MEIVILSACSNWIELKMYKDCVTLKPAESLASFFGKDSMTEDWLVLFLKDESIVLYKVNLPYLKGKGNNNVHTVN